VAYAETSMSRRRFLLHYFGEEFDEVTGDGADMDDNVRKPKKKVEATGSSGEITRSSSHTKHLYKSKEVVLRLLACQCGHKAHRTDTQSFFGCGSEFDENIGWHY
jgi:ATP-dependent DNA helicase RecQ